MLGLALLAGAYLLTLYTVVDWLEGLYQVLWSYRSSRLTFPRAIGTVAYFPLMALLVREMVRISRVGGPQPGSVPVSRTQAPGLWETVRILADRVGTAMPEEIRLTAEVNAAVTDDSWLLGLSPGRRRLYLGVPLLIGLQSDELRAVLAHELGHYARRHVRFSEPANRACAGLNEAHRRIRDALPTNRVLRLPFRPMAWSVGAYARLFARLTRPVRWKQELEADRVAARVAGPHAIASALQSVSALAAAWSTFQNSIAGPYRDATGHVPDHPFGAFALMLQDPTTEPLLSQARKRALWPSPNHEGKSHPPLTDRLARLTAAPGSGAPPQEWADDLELGLEAIEGAVLQRVDQGGFALGAAADRQPWQDWMTGLAAHRAAASTGRLAGVLRTVAGDQAVSLDTALGLLEADRTAELVHALSPLAARGEKGNRSSRRQLADAIKVVIGCALVPTGSVRWGIGWTAPSNLIAVPTVGDIDALVAAAVEDPLQVPQLRRHLAHLGIEPDKVDIDALADAGRDPTTSSGAGPSEEGRRRYRRTAYAAAAVLLLMGTNSLLRLNSHYPDPTDLRLYFGLVKVQIKPHFSSADYEAIVRLRRTADALEARLYDDRAIYGPDSIEVAVTLMELGIVERDIGRMFPPGFKTEGASGGARNPYEEFTGTARARFAQALAILEGADPPNDDLTRRARSLLDDTPSTPR